MSDAAERGGACWRKAFNMRRRSYQIWFVLAVGAAVSIGAIVADAASASFDGAGTIVPVVFTGMCACVGVYTFRKESGETDPQLRRAGA